MDNSNFPENALDEIVFQHRNKAYGAYALRKSYSSHLNKAMLILFFALAFLVIYSRLTSNIHPLKKEMTEEIILPFQPMTNVEFVIEKQPNLEPPHVSLKRTTRSEEMIIKPDTKTIKEPETKKEPASSVNATSGTGVTVSSPITAVVPGSSNVISVTTPEEAAVEFVDLMPSFPGGQEALSNFLRSEIHVPAAAEQMQVTGSVLLSFVIEKDGTVSHVEVVKGKGFGLDEEAERVVKLMPKWNPGKSKNQTVRVKFFLPIRFDY